MNAYDSQVAAGILEQAGYVVLSEGEGAENAVLVSGRPAISQGADIVLLNTCSVRDHAEERVWGRLGLLGAEKKERPDLVIGLMGCMVEEHRESLFKRFPYLDLMVGTRHIKELPDMILQVFETRQHVARIKQDGISIEYSEFTKRDSVYHAWLPIMTGCDKECTFCIVPKTRGAEVSMPAREVMREATRLVAKGVKWITLLGQNVNSYGQTRAPMPETRVGAIPVASRPSSGTAKGASFPELLEMLSGMEGLERISFTTSHPQDATEDLFQAIARNTKIGRRLHLPLQSGSDRILRRMKRLHTYAEYRSKIERLRVLVPDISITTDIIVGFPGETEEDHRETKKALEEIRFDSAFIYKYSARPGTPASRLPDDVLPEIKAARNQELLGVQKCISNVKSLALVGTVCSLFVEDRHKGFPGEFVGRMDQDRRVILESDKDCVGEFVRVTLTDLHHETFRARIV